MSETQLETSEVKAQYTAQVSADLERNSKEQERISAEVAVLQEQLSALQHDQALLEKMRQTLGGTASATAPVPRQVPAQPAPAPPKKAAAPAGKKAARVVGAKAATSTALPTLVTLIHDHLGRQSEPCSAAEIASALDQAHPDRGIKTTVVRTTTEGLVAKGRAQRTKQGASVFYTAVDTPHASAQPQPQDTTQ